MMRWGMPPPPRTGGPPVTNIRDTSSPHWCGWLKPESRCLVPADSLAEYTPESNVVEVYIRSLRRKVDGGRRDGLIETIRGAGYRIRPEDPAE